METGMLTTNLPVFEAVCTHELQFPFILQADPGKLFL